ncbi:MAG: hypothetical protein EAZ81_03775 [Verrucomicrobia bacterium]|nr:MAG: hypothetical protein EAZ81_03775 [Verrucomicrobiota bacterium]
MKFIISLLAASLLPLAAASGPLKDQALALAKTHQDSTLFISAVVSIEVTAGSNPTQKEERKVEVLGTVLSAEGLIVTPLSTLDLASNMDGRTVNTPQGPITLQAKADIKEVKIIMPDGSEVAAKVVLKDADLDLAFIKPEKSAAPFVAIDAKNSAPMSLLDDIIILGRMGKDLNREPMLMTGEIVSVIKKPRLFGKMTANATGMPVFNAEGKFLGIGINRLSSKTATEMNLTGNTVLLPAPDLLESASQIK